MNPRMFSEVISKIHEAFYGKKLTFKSIEDTEVILLNKDEIFRIENHIHTRYRVIFPDYVGKISAFRNLFGRIMNNGDNICDTSDFIDLPKSHVVSIYNYIYHKNINDIKKLKDY